MPQSISPGDDPVNFPAPRVYRDNAATSWPKPLAVWESVEDHQRRLGSPLGRGANSEAAEVARAVQGRRSELAGLLEAEGPDRVAFTLNDTDALNLAIHGLASPDNHVATSVVEQNSVKKPARSLSLFEPASRILTDPHQTPLFQKEPWTLAPVLVRSADPERAGQVRRPS